MYKFYNREREINLIRRVINGSGTRFIIVKGLRRIGKTRTVLEALKGREYAYIFVPKDKSVDLFLEEISQDLKIPKFTSLRDFLNYIFEKFEVVFLDEFQNFYFVEKSAYSDLQKIIDEFRRKNKNLCIIVSGSSYSLVNKIFAEYSKALYGRRDLEITLFELPVKEVFAMLDDIGFKEMEEKMAIWSVFGGIPKFYESLYNLRITSLSEFVDIFFKENFKVLLDEGNAILKSEFGGEYKSFYSAMEAIALGKTKLSEIASVFSNDVNRTNRYLSLLVKEYGLIRRTFPLVGKKKESIYEIKNNFFYFWFRFVKRYEHYYESGNISAIIDVFERNFNSYLGRMFEKFCTAVLRENVLKMRFMLVGKQWGRIPKAKESYEIDIVALNESTKEILFAECKWQNNVNANKIVKDLANKAKYVDWHNDERKEYFAIFAKSFKEKIYEHKGMKVFCYDLRDLENLLE